LSLLLNQIADKTLTSEVLFKKVEKDFTLVPILLEGITSTKATVRYTCARVLVDLSRIYPEKLYNYINQFIELLKSDYRIIKWNAMAIIANLASVDKNKVLDYNFDKYFGLLHDGYMVTVANLASYSSKIGLAKPYLANAIAHELLNVENITLTPNLTEECKRVIAEQAINSFDLMFSLFDEKTKTEVLSFVNNQLESPRDSLKKRAKTFALRWG
jgi:hypothetical protein